MRRREFIAFLGGAAGWPLIGRAQQTERTRLIGVLLPNAANDPVGQVRLALFTQALQRLGWTDGRNVRLEVRWGGGDADRFRKYTAELVALVPDVIVVNTSVIVAILQQATQTVPTVFVGVIDPVGAGFVATLARPVNWNVNGLRSLKNRHLELARGLC